MADQPTGNNINENRQFYFYLTRASVVLRLLFGPAIFISAGIASLTQFILDWVDGELFKRAGYTYSQYSFYDKRLDYYWYAWIMVYVLVQDHLYKNLLLFLFVYRSVGQFIYFRTKKNSVLFFFPNVFEIFFFYCLIVASLNYSLLLQTGQIRFVIVVITSVVLLREYILHIRKMNLSGVFFGRTSYWLRKTRNNHKVLGMVMVLIAFTTAYSLIYQGKYGDYRSLASKATSEMSIVQYFSKEGKLAGLIDSRLKEPLSVHLFTHENPSHPFCSGRITFFGKEMMNAGRKPFLFENSCLVDLPDGQYSLLVSNGRESVILEFVIFRGQLAK